MFLVVCIVFALFNQVCLIICLYCNGTSTICGSTIEPKLGQNDQTVTLQGQCGFLSFFSEHLLLQSWRQHSKALCFFFKCLYFGIKCLICLDCCLVVFFLCVFCMLLRWHWLLQCEIFISVPMWKDIFKWINEWIKCWEISCLWVSVLQLLKNPSRLMWFKRGARLAHFGLRGSCRSHKNQ